MLCLLAGLAAPGARAQQQPAPGDPPPVAVPPGRTWSGRWIWTEGPASPRNWYVRFRGTVQLSGVPRAARLHVTADSRYQVWVNGRFTGRGPVRSDRRYLYYDSWDVTRHLSRGKNVVAVLVHHYGESTFQYQLGRGGLLAELTDESGRVLLATGEKWRASRSEAWGSLLAEGAEAQPRMSIQLGYPEVFDARRDEPRWRESGFSDAGWRPAVELGPAGMAPWTHLVPRDIPPMLEEPMEAARVLAVTEVRSAIAYHVDFLPLMARREWAVGYLAANLVSPDERRVTLYFGSDDALKVVLNGTPVLARLVDRAAVPDQERIEVTLRPGRNLLLLKVVQGHSRWEAYFRLGEGAGDAVRVENPLAPGQQGWAVAGPFAYERDDTLRRGFDTVYPPEGPFDPAARFATGGGDSGWRSLPAGRRMPASVAELMAAQEAGPPRKVEIRNPELAITRGGAGARIRTAEGGSASLLIDFGREVTGYPQFRVRGARGGEIIDLGYGEVLHGPDGGYLPQRDPEATGRLNPARDGVLYADRYLCRPGTQEFQTFDKRGFRYLQVDVRDAPEGIELDGVGLLFSTYPVKPAGAFRCSDERLNRIWEIGRWTCQLNMEDGYTDCPWRERAQWWGDARVEALIAWYAFGDSDLIRKCLRQQVQSLNREGITWGVYPTDWEGGRLPSFTLIWISTLWDYYLHTGDRALVRELFPQVQYILNSFFAPRVGPRGLLKDVPYWVFIDWAPVETEGEGGALNAYYFDALERAAQMAQLIQDPAEGEFRRRARTVREALNTHLWDPRSRTYRDSIRPDGSLSPRVSQQTNSLCVLFGIAPEAEWGGILDAIYREDGAAAAITRAGSPYFSFYQLGALYRAGRHHQALQYIRRQWGKMLDWGATTWWEMWEPGASFCHGWSGGPTYDLAAQYLGVRPLRPGFEEVLVAPAWGDLEWASGVIPTGKGTVTVAWQRNQRERIAAVRVVTPPGVPVEVQLPGSGRVLVNERAQLPTGVAPVPSPAGTTRLRFARGGRALVSIQE